MITIRELKHATSSAAKEINALLPQLSSSPRPLMLNDLKGILRERSNQVVVVLDGKRIVGMGILLFTRTAMGFHAGIEDVVVDAAYRGRGLGQKLMKKLITLARKNKAKSIELSSRPSRVAANKLYQKLGFKPKETNVYRLKL